MVGVESTERVGQRLLGLLNEGRISHTKLVDCFKNYLRHLPILYIMYREFHAVLLASVCRAGAELLQSLPQEALPPTTAHTLPNGQRAENLGTPEYIFLSNRMSEVCHGRRFFVCDTGMGVIKFGLAPRAAQVGDEVVLFLGAKFLYIIRKTDTDNGLPTYGLVGEAYVHGWMNGELLMGGRVSADGPTTLRLRCVDIRLR